MGFSIFNKESKEEKFWNWFEKNQETYYSEIENLEIREKIFNELSKNLKKRNTIQKENYFHTKSIVYSYFVKGGKVFER